MQALMSFHRLTSRAAHSEMFNITKSRFFPYQKYLPVLVDRPVAGNRRRAAGGLFVGLTWTVAVGGGVSNTWAAWRCGRTGGGLGFNLQPLISQGLCKMVINGHTDGKLLRTSFLVVYPQAPLEMLLHHMVIVAFGNHCKRRDGWDQSDTHPCESVKVCGCVVREWPSGGWAYSPESQTDLMSGLGGAQTCRKGSSMRRRKWSQMDASKKQDTITLKYKRHNK